MKRLSVLLGLLLIFMAAPAASAQQNEIPNASFEQWNARGPITWATSNSPEDGFFNVTSSGIAHDGALSARLEVKPTPPPVIVPIPAFLAHCEMQCQRDPDPLPEDRIFPVSQRYTSLSVWVKAGQGGGQLLISVEMFNGLDPVGAGQVTFSPNPAVLDTNFAQVIIPITYISSSPPNQADINFTALAPIGAVFFVDAMTLNVVGGGVPGNALLVVGDKENLTAADVIVNDVLESLGNTVLLMSDEEVGDFSPAGMQVVVVAGSVESGVVNVNWANSAVPIIALEPDVFDDMGISPSIAGTGTNTSAPVTALGIVAPEHPIANGASGTHEVFTSAHGMSFGSLGGGTGTVVARADNAKSVLFAYDAGDRLADGVTINIGRKVGFFMGEESATIATEGGMTLLRNALLWSTRREGEITTSVAIESDDAEIPEAVELAQNYPNPFNPTTTIPFALSDAGPVQLAVYNALGQKVATLVDGVLPSGSYRADFEASTLPSGVYFYRLRSGGTVLSRAMILQK